MSPANEPRQSKSERTAAAREKAREIREAQLKKDKRNKLLIGWGIVAAVVAIIVVVALVVTSNIQKNAPIADEGPTPANGNVYGGVTLLANTEVAKTEPATVRVADIPAPAATPPAVVTAPGAEAEAGKPVKVVLYIDFICPVCKNFETQYNETLTNLRNEGKITVEYRPLGFLDTRSTTNYSSRAANAAACVVNESPEKYADFVNVLFEKQPARGRRRHLGCGSEEDGNRHRGQEHRHVRGTEDLPPVGQVHHPAGCLHRRHRNADRVR